MRTTGKVELISTGRVVLRTINEFRCTCTTQTCDVQMVLGFVTCMLSVNRPQAPVGRQPVTGSSHKGALL